jgi:hypothetical protein
VSGDLNVDRSSETTSQFIRGGDDANTLKGGSGNDIFETGKGNDKQDNKQHSSIRYIVDCTFSLPKLHRELGKARYLVKELYYQLSHSVYLLFG